MHMYFVKKINLFPVPADGLAPLVSKTHTGLIKARSRVYTVVNPQNTSTHADAGHSVGVITESKFIHTHTHIYIYIYIYISIYSLLSYANLSQRGGPRSFSSLSVSSPLLAEVALEMRVWSRKHDKFWRTPIIKRQSICTWNYDCSGPMDEYWLIVHWPIWIKLQFI